MSDVIYSVVISYLRSSVEISELKLIYDEDYKQNMYIGIDSEGLCGYFTSDIECHAITQDYHDPKLHYFTDDVQSAVANLSDEMSFTYYKLL